MSNPQKTDLIAEFERMTIDTGYGDMGLWLYKNRDRLRAQLQATQHIAEALKLAVADVDQCGISSDEMQLDWLQLARTALAKASVT